MKLNRFVIAAAVIGALTLSADTALAQRHGRGGGGARIGRAVPAPAIGHGFRPLLVPRRVVGPVFYGYPRSFYYGPRFSLGIGIGYGYPYSYPYGYYPYGYPYYPYGYGYGGYGYGGYGYGGYGYGGYGYGGYYSPRGSYGGVRLDLPQKGAEVLADGYYVGIVDDFDGVFQRLDLPAGPHRIEVRAPGFVPLAVNINVVPWETIHYRATLIPGP